MIVDVIIPALNEEGSLPLVIADIPRPLVRNIYVCDNGSKDRSVEVASRAGAIVLQEPKRGYGAACLKAINHIKAHSEQSEPDCVVFLDADYSDYPEEISCLVGHLVRHDLDLLIGSRALGAAEKGSLTPVQRFGNRLATVLIRWLYGFRYTDLGPFRVIRWKSLMQLNMEDQNYGWTVEMQVKAVKARLRIGEFPVRYRRRIGVSKVSGTVKGMVMAGYKIIFTIFKHS